MSNDRLLALSILFIVTAILVGYFFDVPRYVPAFILIPGIYAALKAGED